MLAALDAGNASGSTVIDRLRTALPFVELANTDDEFMTEHAEAILMGSAFEQLLTGDASAYKLGKKFGELFGQFGSVTADDARKEPPDIQIDTGTPEIAAAQPKWWVHRKGMEELYDVRSKVVHKDRGACLATDLLLIEKRWVEDRDGRNEGRSWHEVIHKTRSSVRFDSVWKKYKEKHPELFQSDVDEPARAGS